MTPHGKNASIAHRHRKQAGLVWHYHPSHTAAAGYACGQFMHWDGAFRVAKTIGN